jgi:hypothetical protein
LLDELERVLRALKEEVGPPVAATGQSFHRLKKQWPAEFGNAPTGASLKTYSSVDSFEGRGAEMNTHTNSVAHPGVPIRLAGGGRQWW